MAKNPKKPEGHLGDSPLRIPFGDNQVLVIDLSFPGVPDYQPPKTKSQIFDEMNPSERVEAEIQEDLMYYRAVSGDEREKDINLFFGWLFGSINHQIYSCPCSSERKKFLLLKRDSLKEAWVKLMVDRLDLAQALQADKTPTLIPLPPNEEKPSSEVEPLNKVRRVAAIFYLKNAWDDFTSSRWNQQKVRDNPEMTFMGLTAQQASDIIGEYQSLPVDWAMNFDTRKFIEFGQELKKLKKKLHGNTNLGRNYFCLMYWNFFVKKYHAQGTSEQFHEFLGNILRGYGIKVPLEESSLPDSEAPIDCLDFAKWCSRNNLLFNQLSPLPSCSLWQ